MKKRIIFGFLCMVWMIVIFNFSGSQGEESAGLSDRIVAMLHQMIPIIPINDTSIWIVRKLAHFSEYAILGILYVCFFKTFHFRLRSVMMASMLLVFIYACTDEFHQLFVAGRSGQFKDVLIDTAGGTTGILLLYGCQKFWRSNHTGNS